MFSSHRNKKTVKRIITIKYFSFTSPQKKQQEAHGPQFAHLSKTANAYLQMPCNILGYSWSTSTATRTEI